MIKIKHYSALAIKEIIPEANTILISTAGRSQDFIQVQSGYKNILRLAFHDIKRELKGFTLFDESHAKQIISFVNSNLPVDTIYVNCEAGISRSSAVRVFLHEILNKEFIGNKQPCDLHNKHVYNVLKIAYNNLQ